MAGKRGKQKAKTQTKAKKVRRSSGEVGKLLASLQEQHAAASAQLVSARKAIGPLILDAEAGDPLSKRKLKEHREEVSGFALRVHELGEAIEIAQTEMHRAERREEKDRRRAAQKVAMQIRAQRVEAAGQVDLAIATLEEVFAEWNSSKFEMARALKAALPEGDSTASDINRRMVIASARILRCALWHLAPTLAAELHLEREPQRFLSTLAYSEDRLAHAFDVDAPIPDDEIESEAEETHVVESLPDRAQRLRLEGVRRGIAEEASSEPAPAELIADLGFEIRAGSGQGRG